MNKYSKTDALRRPSEFRGDGFTLIELLVVVSIIGLLSSILFASVSTARVRARYARTKAEINQLSKLIDIARGESGKTFAEITGSVCTECACRSIGNVQFIPKTHSCWTTYQAAVSALNAAAAGTISFDQAVSDPWGAPYLFNENEGEGGWCFTDNILSAGPDGFYYNSDDVNVNLSAAKCSPVIGVHHPNTNW